ncbi:heme A synthase [Taibaiella soli]|uniref:Heme A synthase n=2 Tax=Taibaiella soli TaxID=1649169 RepID=A0A2W2AHK7_9BACT|nr:heme A synthase [Taibaiella soli]
MIMIQVLLGGITRLTGSGLSIAEWNPILGAVPPMNGKQWDAAFELYKQKAAGQFVFQNSDFTLSDFKSIYFWEWLHREWARLMGGVFVVGFVYFLLKKAFDKQMIVPFVILFVLGGLQGGVGWIMVASGLNPEDTHVSHIKLALHFMAALILLCYVLWFALQLLIPKDNLVRDNHLHRYTIVTIGLLVIQLMYGAFMAGLKAAPAAPTWPKINGSWLPQNLETYAGNSYSGVHLIADQPIMIHLIHRTLAYTLFFVIIVWGAWALKVAAKSNSSLLKKASYWPVVLVLLQVLLGIFTVLNAPLMTQNKFGRFEIIAEMHQLVAMFLLMSLMVNIYIIRRQKA